MGAEHAFSSQNTKFACVFGNPIEQSKSPIIHQLFAKQFDISIDYQKRLAGIDEFAKSADSFFQNPYAIGANVTMPFKHDALKWVDTLSIQAKKADAVNTIIRTSKGFMGENTDGIGLVNDLKRHQVNLNNAKLLLIGAGGAAKGALPALVDAGVSHVSLYNRSPANAAQLIAHSHTYAPNLVQLYKSEDTSFDVIINATSLSLHAQIPALPDTIFFKHPVVYDMVYQSQPTAFLQHATQMGCGKTIDGLGMLVEQAAHSFFLWFAVKPDTDRVFNRLRL